MVWSAKKLPLFTKNFVVPWTDLLFLNFSELRKKVCFFQKLHRFTCFLSKHPSGNAPACFTCSVDAAFISRLFCAVDAVWAVEGVFPLFAALFDWPFGECLFAALCRFEPQLCLRNTRFQAKFLSWWSAKCD